MMVIVPWLYEGNIEDHEALFVAILLVNQCFSFKCNLSILSFEACRGAIDWILLQYFVVYIFVET